MPPGALARFPAEIIPALDAHPGAHADPDARFFFFAPIWTGEASFGPTGLGRRASLAYSFVLDGARWGELSLGPQGPCDLRTGLRNQFGFASLDLGFEYIRAALAAWQSRSGLRFFEVPDDGAPIFDPRNRALHGDIRIGARPYGDDQFLAYTFLPSGGGSLTINSSQFLANFSQPANTWRYFRNAIAHEVGHAIGLLHATPCNNSKLMEPYINSNFDFLAQDEVRAVQFGYGDRFSGNSSIPDAHDLGALDSPAPRSLIFRGLSVIARGAAGSTPDVFRFSLTSTQTVTVDANPVGDLYKNGQQTFACDPFDPPLVNAKVAGQVAVRITDQSGANLGGQPLYAQSGPGLPSGVTITLGPGVYYAFVADVHPNPSPQNQFVQLYDLTVSAGLNPLPPPPRAVAGVDKRVRANTACFFLGDLNSSATNPAATLTDASYDWDLDGDGVFETTATPRPVTVYSTNGPRTVTLRLTDSAGGVAYDSITVTVVGAVPMIHAVTPAQVQRGAVTPITITGVNIGLVLFGNQCVVSGAGVAVLGTPAPDADGATITGLSLAVDPGADIGPRDLTLNAFNGAAVAPAALVITRGPPCIGDLSGDNRVDFLDLSLFLQRYGRIGTVGADPADFNRDGVVNHLDLAILLQQFGVPCAP